MITEANKEEGLEVKTILCQMPIGCGGCGLLANVKDNKIVSMRGNREFPNSRGHVCRDRFPHLIKWLGHPDQLMYPLKRVGERGENKWERIDWEQALDEIAEKLKNIKAQYGAESLVSMEGIGDIHGIRGRFLNLFGNPANVSGPGSVCNCNKRALHIALTGSIIATGGSRPVEVYLTPDCIIFAGLSLVEGEPFAWHQFRRRLKEENRPKVIVIDPRRTKLAENADLHLQIRPGTDTALFMAWLNVIIEEGLYDKDFIDKWTFGFDELKQRALEYTPERIAEITWIPANQIRECARIYATSRASSLITGLALDLVGLNGVRAEQARICLEAITGNLARLVPGRPMGPGPVIDGKMAIRDSMLQLEDKLPPEMRKKQIGSDRFKLMAWPAWEITSQYYQEVYGIPQCMSGHNISSHQPSIWRAILTGKPYPVKAMITWTGNPLVTAANTKQVYQALKSPNLELHVVLEHFMTPTALLADYVLPAASKYEKPTCSTAEDFAPGFKCGERAIQPMGERHTDYEFFRALALRLGMGEYFLWKNDEELADYRLAPLGITFKEAATEMYGVKSDEPWTFETINPKTGKPTGFATPSGKLELYSNVLKELGYDPLPFYEEPPESPIRTPDVARDYPLILTTCGRVTPFILSMHRQLGLGLREQYPEPLVEIHPDTAQEYGIADGDWTCIETLRGVIRQKAKLSTAIHPKVVKVDDGWWFPEQPAEEPCLHGLWQSNASVLTVDDPDACDRLTGGYACSALLCKVYRAPTP
jgi:thiosulfate reductase/polysulfide reductase chain A